MLRSSIFGEPTILRYSIGPLFPSNIYTSAVIHIIIGAYYWTSTSGIGQAPLLYCSRMGLPRQPVVQMRWHDRLGVCDTDGAGMCLVKYFPHDGLLMQHTLAKKILRTSEGNTSELQLTLALTLANSNAMLRRSKTHANFYSKPILMTPCVGYQ